MFLKYLINPKPSIIFFFIVFCIVFTIFPLINTEFTVFFNHKNISPIFLFLSAIIIPFFTSLGLNNMIYEKNVVRKENLVIGIIFILISSSFTNNIELWVSAFIMLFLFNFLIGSYQKELPFTQFYNSAFILSLITFLYPNLIYLAIIFIVSGINYNNMNWRIFFTLLLGLITPYIFYYMFVFILEKELEFPNFVNFSKINLLSIKDADDAFKVWIGIILLVMIFSFMELLLWLYKKSIKSRKTFMTIIWTFILSIIIAVCSGKDYLYFCLIPLAIIIGNYFVYTKNRKIANILFYMLVISSFYYKYMNTYNL